MEINDTMEFIHNVYSSYNISHSLLIYNKDEVMRCDIDELYRTLVQKDYPVFEILDVPTDLFSLENRYRMFIIDDKMFQEFLHKKDNDLSNISVVFCLSSQLLHSTCELLRKHKVNTSSSMHLFSC